MQLTKRVMQLAKERALIKFSALARAMVKDADARLAQGLANARSGADQHQLSMALQALRQLRAVLVDDIDARFRDKVERGMRTMYTDLRQGLDRLSANTLSLIDDEAVNQQLEVGQLVQRLRDACDENLGRLNIMIAQMHGDVDVHERENPFRPYLIARALYDGLNHQVTDEKANEILFAYLSDSLAAHLSGYYKAICEVFDENGIQARLLARPTRLKRHQRDQLAQQLAALNSGASTYQPGAAMPTGGGGSGSGSGGTEPADMQVNPRILAVLQRMFESLPGQAGASGNETRNDVGGAGRADEAVAARFAGTMSARPQLAEGFEEFVWQLFSQAQTVLQDGAGGPAPASTEALEQITRYQRQVAESGDAPADARNQLFSLSEQLAAPEQSQREKMAIDVVAMLFEFILEDEQIPPAMRARLARLQIPFLKAAMLEPQLLQQADHPARLFLNRIASATVGLDPASDVGQALDGEIARLVKRILRDFDQDVGVFGECLRDLEGFLGQQLANADAETTRSIQAAEEAEKFSAVLRNTQASLHDIVAPLEIDQRVTDFIEQVWARVLVRAASQEAAGEPSGLAQQYREVLPELVWSAQKKNTPEERNALMRMLPGLVKRLRIGMLMVQMPEDECKAALDRLVPVHMQVLRPATALDATLPGSSSSLEDLRNEFSRLVTSDDSAAWVLTEPLQVEAGVLENALADRGIAADLELSRPSPYATTPSPELLLQLQVGSCVECRAADTAVQARLIWVSQFHSLFIFKLEGQAKPLVYSAAALLQALKSGKMALSEYAPAFDRAVDALMMGAEAVQAARPRG